VVSTAEQQHPLSARLRMCCTVEGCSPVC
jgi:hypothetical protein